MSAERKPGRLARWGRAAKELLRYQPDELILPYAMEFPVGEITDDIPLLRGRAEGAGAMQDEPQALARELDKAIRKRIALHPEDAVRNELNSAYMADFSTRGRRLPLSMLSVGVPIPGSYGEHASWEVEVDGIRYGEAFSQEQLPPGIRPMDRDTSVLFVAGIRNHLSAAKKVHLWRPR